MRRLLLVPALTLALVALAGCCQTRSACNSTKSAWNSTQNAWNQGKQQVNRFAGRLKKERAVQKAPVVEACANTSTRCGPAAAATAKPSECLCWAQPIYPNRNGGDNGIGRGGTGAFRTP